MSLRAKIVAIGVAQILVVALVLFGAYYRQARAQVVQQYVEKSRAIVLTAEATREEMGRKWDQGLFSATDLQTWATRGEREKILSAVPVVTGWRAAMAKAREGGYTFRVPKFQPRNPANLPDELEARVLKAFEEQGAAEHYEIDPTMNAVRYFRPVRLTKECLLCHGEPSTSVALWGNDRGLDPTGARMENWKVGEVHGAFEVIQSLQEADARLASSLATGAGVVLLLVTVAAGLLFWLTTRMVVAPVAAVVDGIAAGASEVAAVAAQVSHASQSLSSGSTEQAASLEETSATMEEMSSITSRNAEHSEQAAQLMSDVDAKVTNSNRALDSTIQTMQAIETSSARVSKIIKTIDEIAFQTNLLALNAAVEAARAGSAGMGFAVVADEVRTLAQRSALAARDTAGLIEEASANAASGVARVQELGAAIAEITASVGHVKGLVDDVSTASRQQADAIGQVGQALVRMERITQGNAASSEESAAASEQLSAQAEVSHDLVEHLRRIVGASDGDRPAPARTLVAPADEGEPRSAPAPQLRRAS
jgi:methyl-accepting chemotaxis protein